MQENVKVFTPEVLHEIFGKLEVQEVKSTTEPEGNQWTATYKTKVDIINGDDLIKLVTVYLEYNVGIAICRSGKGLLIRVDTYPEGHTEPRVWKMIPLETV